MEVCSLKPVLLPHHQNASALFCSRLCTLYCSTGEERWKLIFFRSLTELRVILQLLREETRQIEQSAEATLNLENRFVLLDYVLYIDAPKQTGVGTVDSRVMECPPRYP